MPSWSALSEVPIEEYRLCDSVRCGAGGGSRTHFSHPFLDAYYGLLRDVSAARRLSRSAFGGRSQPRPRCPRQFGPSLLEPYKLVENLELPVRNVRVSRSIPRLLLVLRLLLYGHSRSSVWLS